MESKQRRKITVAVATAIVVAGVAATAGIYTGHRLTKQPNSIATTSTPVGGLSTTPSGNQVNATPKQGTLPVQRIFSSAAYAKLSGYAKRVQVAKQLPLPATGTNVIYISPASGYAISQFQSEWKHITPTPTVVWLDTTATSAQSDWTSLGYKSDPLPSANTQYVTSMIPEPDSYHLTKNGWVELPGILRPSQAKDWITFFHLSKTPQPATSTATLTPSHTQHQNKKK